MTNKAIIKQGVGQPAIINTAIPKLRDEYMTAKTVAVALNLADWKSLDKDGHEGTIAGLDYSSTAVAISKVRKNFKKSDRFFSFSFDRKFQFLWKKN